MPCRLTIFMLIEGPEITLKYFGKSFKENGSSFTGSGPMCLILIPTVHMCLHGAHSNWFVLLNMLPSNYSSDFACPENGG